MNSRSVVGFGLQLLLGACLLPALVGCGGEAAPEPKAPEAAPPAVETTPEPVAAAEPKPEGDAGPDGEATPEPAAEAKGPPKDPNAMREVKYVVTPEGLKIEVAGVRFLASAEAKKIAQGWGAKITVKAEVTDGKPHVLLNPKNGPIAFAAAVFKKGSTEAERIPDGRDGEGEMKLAPGAPTSFTREFPNKGGRVLAIGEVLDMEVALWGLGETSEDRRPVKQFFHVKMKVDKGKPKAIVEPPASAAQ